MPKKIPAVVDGLKAMASGNTDEELPDTVGQAHSC